MEPAYPHQVSPDENHGVARIGREQALYDGTAKQKQIEPEGVGVGDETQKIGDMAALL